MEDSLAVEGGAVVCRQVRAIEKAGQLLFIHKGLEKIRVRGTGDCSGDIQNYVIRKFS